MIRGLIIVLSVFIGIPLGILGGLIVAGFVLWETAIPTQFGEVVTFALITICMLIAVLLTNKGLQILMKYFRLKLGIFK